MNWEYVLQYLRLLKKLAAWLNSSSGISEAYLVVRQGSLSFVAIKDKAEYAEAAEDALTELDYSIANDPDLNLIDLECMSFPRVSHESLEPFIAGDIQLRWRPGGDSAGWSPVSQ